MDIDIVIPWVDSNDEEWQKEKAKYSETGNVDSRIIRYREWDNLQYVFRGIELNLPWIRKIHFITYGHIPHWLNTKHPKLHIVRHSDYIPLEYLPTFSSHPIELNMYRIEGLSDHFIYANDDTFFIRPLKERDFFINGLPCDSALETIHIFKKGGIDNVIQNDLSVLNAHFSKKNVINAHPLKWFNYRYGKYLLKNIYLYPFKSFLGFENPHMPNAFLKRTFQELWNCEPIILNKTSMNKYRSNEDVNQWLARYWQLATGNFAPRKINLGKFYSIGKDDIEIEHAIINQKYSMLCLSDDTEQIDFEYEKEFINNCLKELFPIKSSYEI